MSTALIVAPQLKATMLKQLVAGHDLDFVATAAGMPRDRVLDIVSHHGYPNTTSMAWAAEQLLDDANKIPQRQAALNGVRLDEPATGRRPQSMLHAQSTGHRPMSAPDVRTSARPVHTSTGELLHQAGRSAHARTRALGAKISTLLTDLTTRLAEEQEALEAKAKAERESAAVAAKIAQLEAELAKLKAKRPKTKTGVVSTHRESSPSESAVIREWARANNIPCPRVGTVPKDVRTAYSAAVGAA